MPKVLNLDFSQDNLVGSVNYTAGYIDPGLQEPWGIAVHHKGCHTKQIAVAAYGSGNVYQFDACGNQVGPVIATLNAGLTGPGHPTGLAYNPCCRGFPIVSGGDTSSSCLLVADGAGFINGYSDNVNVLFAIHAVGPTGSYTGLALHKEYLYAANFLNGTIDKYSSTWELVAQYVDPDLAATGFNPYNVAVVDYRGCKRLAVTFAYSGGTATATSGIGFGFVDIFGWEGSYHRFINQGPLNAPWGIFSLRINGCNYIGVGNNGDGRINFFDEEGKWTIQAQTENGLPLALGNLFGVAPNPSKAMLYAASGVSIEGNYSGLFSRLTVT